MNEHGKKLKQYMHDHGIKGEYLVFTDSCHTVQEAEQSTGAKPGEVIKNICLISDEMIIATVSGEDRVSTTKVGEALKKQRPRTATPEEILEKTGYPAGGVPSFGFNAVFIIDDKVMQKSMIYTSGGTPNSLIKIQPSEMQRASNAIVARIRK
ncbi:hypothetical protein HYU11_06110 [Candidatus Woesearchaeota archaeon]|nr:hypothetical protein [Candidatus Woesearchaeota archaeon]